MLVEPAACPDDATETGRRPLRLALFGSFWIGHAALRADSPQVHPWGNVLSHMEIKRGDADTALAPGWREGLRHVACFAETMLDKLLARRCVGVAGFGLDALGHLLHHALAGLLVQAGEGAAQGLVEQAALEPQGVDLGAHQILGAHGVDEQGDAGLFDAQIVVVGGGVIAAGELLLRPARAEVARRALPQLRKGVKIVAAKFGPDAGFVGAATFALQEPAGSKS